MTSDAHASRKSSLLALALCAFAYLYVYPYQSKLNNPNENVRVYMTAALVEEGRYEIDTFRARWGYVNDAGVHGGHFYSVKAPGASYLAVPGYAAYLGLTRALDRPFDRTEALWLCRLTGSILPALLWLFWLHRWLCRRGHDPLLRDATFFSIALGSMLYGYGMLLVSHTQSAAAGFASFMLLADVRERGATPSFARSFAAGLLAALVTFFEYPGLICSVALSVYAAYVLWPRAGARALAAFALGGALPALAMMHFHWSAFGNPFTPGHLYVENDAFRAAHHQGLYGAVAPSWVALHGLLVDFGAGFFPLTPLLWLALPGLYLMCRGRERAEGLCLSAILALTVLAISSMNNWRAGWTIGARYLALCVPFAGYAALLALERWARAQRWLASAFAIGATATGLLASGVPSAYYPHLPPELTRPLPQLFAVLIAHDYAPRNAGALLGQYGSASMLPLLLTGLAALGTCLWGAPAGLRPRVAAAATAVALLLAIPLWVRPVNEAGVPEAVAFVTRRWTPAGHDAASRFALELREARTPLDPGARERLAELFLREGRTDEARRMLKGPR